MEDSMAELREMMAKLGIEPTTEYEYISEGMIRIEVDGKKGFKNTDGQIVIEPVYDWAGTFDEGLAVVKKDGHFSFIDKSGDVVVELGAKYRHVSYFSEGLAEFSMDVVCECCETRIGIRHGFLDKEGNVVIKPLKWTHAFAFSEGLAAVRRDTTEHKWSYIDKSGDVVFTLGCDHTGYFTDGYASFRINGQNGLVDKSGNIVVEPGDFNIHYNDEEEHTGLPQGWYKICDGEWERISSDE